MRGTATLGALVPLVLAASCGTAYSGDDPLPLVGDRPDGAAPAADAATDASGGGDATVLPECAAQRVVNIVAGTGALAWFTLVWPVPQVITAYNPMDAYDNPSTASVVGGTEADHPLFARKIGSRAVWQGISPRPDPTVFVVGTNQTHTTAPQAMGLPGGADALALGAAAQAPLGPALPAIAFSPAIYGATPGTPVPASVNLIEDAINAIKAKKPLTDAEAADLRPSPTIVSSWVGPAPLPSRNTMAQQLLFAANAFRAGLVSTILIPGFADDPHGAFANGDTDAAASADTLARILDGFYIELAKSSEKTCGHAGKPLSLADNVVLVINGDTFKNPFARNGWGDATPGNSNLVFVRSNGFLKPGWLGRIASTDPVRTNFNPKTGVGDANATVAESTTASVLGVLYAITRGNKTAVDAASKGAPYAGVLGPGP